MTNCIKSSNFINIQEIPADMQEVIRLYQKFSRYDKNTPEEIYHHILPSFKLKQYKIHTEEGEVIAFTNWAFLNEKVEKYYIKTGMLNSSDWKSGDKLWHFDTVCVKNLKKVMDWTKNYFTKKFGIGYPIHWLRISDDDKIYRRSKRLTKKSWIK